MCWMALIPVAIGAVSGLMQGQANQKQANSQAEALRTNALYLGNAANDARVRGIQDSDWARVQGGQMIGTQRAAMASNGGLVDSGTNALAVQDTAQLAEFDALVISNNAAREAYGYDVEREDMLKTATKLQKDGKKQVMTSMLGGALQGFGASGGGGMFGGGASAGSGGLGLGTQSALQGSTRLNYNQAYA